MAKKLKKAKKGMNPKVKFTLVHSFKGLISNQSVIDGSKGSPWWVAAIFLVFSVFLPLIPTFSRLSRINGAQFIGSYTYAFDEHITRFTYQAKKAGWEFKVDGGKLHYYHNDVEQEFVDPQEDSDYFTLRKSEYEYVNPNSHQVEVRCFIWKDTHLQKNVDVIMGQTYLLGGTDKPTGAKGEKVYLPNIVILTPSTMAIALHKVNTKTSAGTTYGGLNWLHTSTEIGLVERLLGEHASEVATKTESGFVNEYKADVLKEFKRVCVETYLDQKVKTKWSNTGIYAGIYAGVIVFLGLMVFILTRGKNNPYKFLNIWECEKISWWGAASPAIIGTLLSLIFSGNALGQMAFILVVSLRIMWLSMKQLRPMIQ